MSNQPAQPSASGLSPPPRGGVAAPASPCFAAVAPKRFRPLRGAAIPAWRGVPAGWAMHSRFAAEYGGGSRWARRRGSDGWPLGPAQPGGNLRRLSPISGSNEALTRNTARQPAARGAGIWAGGGRRSAAGRALRLLPPHQRLLRAADDHRPQHSRGSRDPLDLRPVRHRRVPEGDVHLHRLRGLHRHGHGQCDRGRRAAATSTRPTPWARSRRQIILKVLVPLAMPSIFNSLRLLFGLAFGYIMLAEVDADGSEAGGLGDIINLAQGRGGHRTYILLVLMIIPLVALAHRSAVVLGPAAIVPVPVRRRRRSCTAAMKQVLHGLGRSEVALLPVRPVAARAIRCARISPSTPRKAMSHASAGNRPP